MPYHIKGLGIEVGSDAEFRKKSAAQKSPQNEQKSDASGARSSANGASVLSGLANRNSASGMAMAGRYAAHVAIGNPRPLPTGQGLDAQPKRDSLARLVSPGRNGSDAGAASLAREHSTAVSRETSKDDDMLGFDEDIVAESASRTPSREPSVADNMWDVEIVDDAAVESPALKAASKALERRSVSAPNVAMAGGYAAHAVMGNFRPVPTQSSAAGSRGNLPPSNKKVVLDEPKRGFFAGLFSVGPRLQPLELWGRLNKMFSGAKDKDLPQLVPKVETPPLKVLKNESSGSQWVVSHPCHDFPARVTDVVTRTINGRWSIPEVIGEVSAQQRAAAANVAKGVGQAGSAGGSIPLGPVRVLIPISQSNPYLFGRNRGHFTLFSATIRAGKLEDPILYDPKGVSSFSYDGVGHIRKQLEDAGISVPKEGVRLKKLQHQGVFNFNDCGRYVCKYISAIVNGGSPEKLSNKDASNF